MEPLFSLYGDSTQSTQMNFTDEDILRAKQAANKELLGKILSTEVLSPRDEPSADLYNHCKTIVDNVHKLVHASEDRSLQKVVQLLKGQDDIVHLRGLAYLSEQKNPALAHLLGTQELTFDQFQNCLAVVIHFDMPTQEELAEEEQLVIQDNLKKEERKPFYKKHPLITAAIVLGVVSAIARR